MEKSFDFVGLGFCSNDYLCILPYIPLDNKVKIIRRLIQGGGPAGNSTVAASKLGLRAAFVSAIGDDADGRKMLEDFEAEKVCTRGIKVRGGCESPLAYCWIDEPTGARSVAWTRGNTPELEADEVDLSLLEGAKILHIDGHNPKGALAAAKRAKELGVLVNFDAGTVRDGIAELLPYACFGVAIAGLMYIILSSLFKIFGVKKVMRYFPPIVTGPIIICIGMTLANSAINNCTGSWDIALVAILTLSLIHI